VEAFIDGAEGGFEFGQLKGWLKKAVVVAFGVDEYDIAGVVYGVVIPLGDFAKGHIDLVGKAAQGEEFAGYADKARVEVAHIFGQYFGSIARWVYADQNHLGSGGQLLWQGLVEIFQIYHGHGADIRALGKAEVQQR